MCSHEDEGCVVLEMEEDVVEPEENVSSNTVVVVSHLHVKHDGRKTLVRDEELVDAEVDGLASIVVECDDSVLACIGHIVRGDFHLPKEGRELAVDSRTR